MNWKSFCEISVIQKLLLSFLVLFFLLLFIENFLFSDSFSTLQLREIDDIAFQVSLRNIHHDISSLKLYALTKVNYYGYGWIFWIIVGVVTYPFYLLTLATDFYVPLIVIPRQISLLFTVGSAVFIYKSLCIYSKNEFLKFVAMLLLFSFPAFGHFAMRFGTVSQVMFFSSLAFYLTIRKETYEKSDLRNIALAAAACVGTKLNGALILPLLGLIMADRLGWKLSKENLKKAGYFLGNLFFFAVLFSNPSLFLSPFKPQYLSSYLDSLKNNSHLALQDNFFETLKKVLEVGYLNFYVAVILCILLLLNSVKKGQKKDLLFASLWLIISLLLLVKVMSMGSLYIINYIMVVMYLIIFGILFLERFKKFGNFIAAALLILSLTLSYKKIYYGFYSDFKYFQLQNSPKIIDKIKTSNAIKNLIADPKDNPDLEFNVLMDSEAIFPYSHFDRENLTVVFSFNDIHIVKDQIKGDFDYISLNKNASAFYEDQKFADFIKTIKDEVWVINHIENRKVIQNLITHKKFYNSEYEVLFDSKNLILFKKKI